MPEITPLPVNGHTLGAYCFNEERQTIPVIFIHGVLGSIDFWRDNQSPFIKDNFRWVSLSLPGHAPALFPADYDESTFGAEQLADTLWQGIKQLIGDQKFIIGGHSTGGFAALAVAARHPEQIAGVISVAGFAHGKWIGVLGQSQLIVRRVPLGKYVFRSMMSLGKRSNFIMMSTNQKFYYDFKAIKKRNPNLEAAIMSALPMYRTQKTKALVPYFRKMPDIDITPWLENITAPTLVIVGDHDPVVPPSQSRLIADKIRGASYVEIENCGHVVPISHGEIYHHTIADWIKTFL